MVEIEGTQQGFAVQLRRWVIERASSRISRRRLARNHEAAPASTRAFVLAAATIPIRQVIET
ncbi:hypothetical protein [Methylobacterium sp. PvR107]|uniref:hypothetical protein n=1 Tax=Methylobacterium sp. PvR107 TaxID=2806597 RepID=UPI001AE4F514|nr:hypothetical protein [Methylobacterium sp. PvR107]MBP1178470.1 hypothetical protein [Methylobacterium sp. PvR107]